MRTAKEVAAEVGKKGRGRAAPARTGDAELGRKLGELRRSHGLRTEDVAREVGLTRPGLSNIETGVALAGLRTLARLAVFYDVTLDHLCGHMVEEAKRAGAR